MITATKATPSARGRKVPVCAAVRAWVIADVQYAAPAKTQHGHKALRQNSHAVAAIGYGSRQPGKDEQRQRNQRAAARNRVNKAGRHTARNQQQRGSKIHA